jgi:hypothetical protein
LAETISKPQEDTRLQVPRELLLGTISGMEEAMQGCIHDLLFDLEEIGVLEWEDRKSKKVVILSAMSRQTIRYGFNRNLKHITAITCAAASGEHVIPNIITSQESDDLREAPRKKALNSDRS